MHSFILHWCCRWICARHFCRFVILFVTDYLFRAYFCEAEVFFFVSWEKKQKNKNIETRTKQQCIHIFAMDSFFRAWMTCFRGKKTLEHSNETWQMIWRSALQKSLTRNITMNLKWWARETHLPMEALLLILLVYFTSPPNNHLFLNEQCWICFLFRTQ